MRPSIERTTSTAERDARREERATKAQQQKDAAADADKRSLAKKLKFEISALKKEEMRLSVQLYETSVSDSEEDDQNEDWEHFAMKRADAIITEHVHLVESLRKLRDEAVRRQEECKMLKDQIRGFVDTDLSRPTLAAVLQACFDSAGDKTLSDASLRQLRTCVQECVPVVLPEKPKPIDGTSEMKMLHSRLRHLWRQLYTPSQV